jgi:TRAP-type mannitol/chloroaromatic compound transport system permease small subunit
MIRKFIHFIIRSTEWVGEITSWLCVLVMLILAYEVVARHGFGRPTIWAWDISAQVAGAFALLGGAYCFVHEGHVKLDILSSRYSGRLKALMELLLAIPLFILCLVLLWYGGSLAWTSVVMREHAMTLFSPPLYPVRVLLVLAAFWLLVCGIAKFVRDLDALFAVSGKNDEA